MKIERLETYSNIAYFVSGLIGFAIFEDYMTRVIYLLAMTLLCVGSFLYHKHKEGHIYLFDWHAINVAFTCFAGLLFNSPLAWVLIISFQFVYGLFIIGKYNVYAEVIGGALPLAIGLFIYLPTWQALAVLAGFAIAALIRRYDNKKNKADVYYDSKNHAWWHVITAFVPLLIFA
jgi:uncharacterized oligopeptide transporter (OPT) family protein